MNRETPKFMQTNTTEASPTSPMLDTPHIYSVSELNAAARGVIEGVLKKVWIVGEISNLSQPSSGHLYFSLKDSQSQVRCALFRGSRSLLKFTPQNGQQVLVSAQPSVYEARGDFQIIVSTMEMAGDGVLQAAFEQLKKRLEQEGLFAQHLKKPLPQWPKNIGIITSSTGAAVRDVLTVLKRRFMAIPVIIYPSLVQGAQAASQIAAAIEIANQRNECDVLILARGGGSLEDLWPFNEEIVARAIFASRIPIITGIGHEIDFTIADFVADLRAATPSAAAETVSPDGQRWLHQWQQWHNRFTHLMLTKLQHLELKLTHISKRLQHPGQRLREQMQRLDRLEQSLLLAKQNFLRHRFAELNHLATQFLHHNPQLQIIKYQQKIQDLQQRLHTTMQYQLQTRQQQIQYLARTLQAISPLQTLERGFSITRNKQTQQIIRDSAQVKTGDLLEVQLAKGHLDCKVMDQ